MWLCLSREILRATNSAQRISTTRVSRTGTIENVPVGLEGIDAAVLKGTMGVHILVLAVQGILWAMGQKMGVVAFANNSTFPVTKLALGISFVFLAFIIAATVLYFSMKKRKLMKLRRKVLPAKRRCTLGYLDPEYFHTSQLTEKSDVYSFGVVLAELMTGRKPLSSNTKTDEEKSLSTFFVVSLKEDRLFQIVDPRVLREGSLEQIRGVGELVRRCLRLQSEERPTMKEVAMELEGLRKISKHPWAGQEEVQEEGVGLMSRDQQSDLYEVPIDSGFMSTPEYSGQFSSGSRMIHPINSPR
ncbi:wall-associated receptor kinase-like 2 [Phtheirospermum japonicum]|uniref:Wall-associated receptor kinase-like 2 n=1 Tax=Phtheirospermum japonicum TaxID=374723 RepID=A0A830CME3_9LAMI|nr:wall-associated receptor kinase-like 2 [Phtheirospermum japonicum]